jgi:aldose 1-epimerase
VNWPQPDSDQGDTVHKLARVSFLVCAVTAGWQVVAGAGSPEPQAKPQSGVTRASFGTVSGQPVDIFTLRNANGVEIKATNYGGIITSIVTPDRKGNPGDIVLGFDTIDLYLKDSPYFGAVVGRYGNRIAKGRFTVDGRVYTLATNNGPNHLHGGLKGFDKVVWKAEPLTGRTGITLSRRSPDGEEGYPGNLDVRITYELTDRDELVVDYHATTDKATPVNLTQHTYFNLAGAGDILGHRLMIEADRYTPVDSTLIPTGELAPVQGTPFDFRTPTTIGARIGQSDEQLKNGGGYDHNWVLNRKGSGLQLAARVVEPQTGRTLEVSTTEPGLQFYSGNFLDGTITGKRGRVYQRRNGLCLETQHYPDSPNQSKFPSTILSPGAVYASKTVFRFGVVR